MVRESLKSNFCLIISKWKKLFPAIAFLFLLYSGGKLRGADPVKIMLVGNSITAGEYFGYPPIEERTGYRQYLYNMLAEAGYSIDFVGTQKHGERPESDPEWYDWNNEAYPGWAISDIARNTIDALPIFFPDILLIHVGTNGDDWEAKPRQVMQMLDSINQFSVINNHPITVLLCKIINLYIEQDQLPTSQFNIKLEELVKERSDDRIKIILVDMEKGAGLDYSDRLPDPDASPPYEGGDMRGTQYPGVAMDPFHPNEKGNIKIAYKFHEELIRVLERPSQ